MSDTTLTFAAYAAPSILAVVLFYLALKFETWSSVPDDEHPYGDASTYGRRVDQ